IARPLWSSTWSNDLILMQEQIVHSGYDHVQMLQCKFTSEHYALCLHEYELWRLEMYDNQTTGSKKSAKTASSNSKAYHK
ncbi:hypothetical protein Tco_1039257, partial [Tanacetum coccineum]